MAHAQTQADSSPVSVTLYPSAGRMLVMLYVSLFASGMVIALFTQAPSVPVAVRVMVGLLPSYMILARWIIHRPALMADQEGIMLCGFDF